MYVGTRGLWELSVPSTHFAVNLKLIFKKSQLKKQNRKERMEVEKGKSLWA